MLLSQPHLPPLWKRTTFQVAMGPDEYMCLRSSLLDACVIIPTERKTGMKGQSHLGVPVAGIGEVSALICMEAENHRVCLAQGKTADFDKSSCAPTRSYIDFELLVILSHL